MFQKTKKPVQLPKKKGTGFTGVSFDKDVMKSDDVEDLINKANTAQEQQQEKDPESPWGRCGC